MAFSTQVIVIEKKSSYNSFRKNSTGEYKTVLATVSRFLKSGNFFQGIWKAWKQTPKASPSPNLVQNANFDDLLTKIANCLGDFRYLDGQTFLFDLIGLRKRFCSIPSDRTFF